MKKTGIIIIIFITGIISSISAQDSLRMQNLPDGNFSSSGNGFQKRQLSLGIFWRNVITGDLVKWGAGLNYKLKDGASSDVYTAGFAAHLTFNTSRHIGVVTGLEIVNYSGRASGNFEDNYTDDNLRFHYILAGYREKQQLVLLSIPLMLKYSTAPLYDISAKYFAAAGFKFGIPLTDRATIDPGSVTTYGEFLREDETYINFPEHGFVNEMTGFNQKSKMDIKLGVTLALEAGINFLSDENISAIASIYCDLGLNNMIRRDNKKMVEYLPYSPEHLQFNSIMRTDKANSMAISSIGLKLSVSFNLDKQTK
jgi:hypothetical protein